MTITHRQHYFYAKSTSVEWEDMYNRDLTAKKLDKLHQQASDIEALIEDEREVIGNNIYKALEQDYDYQRSDEAVIDTIEANEYTFFEDGRQFTL